MSISAAAVILLFRLQEHGINPRAAKLDRPKVVGRLGRRACVVVVMVGVGGRGGGGGSSGDS